LNVCATTAAELLGTLFGKDFKRSTSKYFSKFWRSTAFVKRSDGLLTPAIGCKTNNFSSNIRCAKSSFKSRCLMFPTPFFLASCRADELSR
jgi:hypothetical protein